MNDDDGNKNAGIRLFFFYLSFLFSLLSVLAETAVCVHMCVKIEEAIRYPVGCCWKFFFLKFFPDVLCMIDEVDTMDGFTDCCVHTV